MNQISRYKILKRLGGGGFGEVFLGEDPAIGRQVAIKVFKPKDENLIAFATSSDEEGLEILRARFLNEAKILASLEDQPNIVSVHEYGELEDGAPFYVMPYLPNSLSDELGKDVFDVSALEELPEAQRPRALPLERGLEILEQILTGLAAAHAKGLIHRDIKPSNLMLSESGQLRIVDFGIAKAPDGQYSTVSHLGLGSRNYMSPEQRESAKHVDVRADVYSVGEVAYRMITGKLPIGRFADPNVAVPALGQPMNDLLLSMMAVDKAERPNNAAQALEQFQQARKSVGEDDRSSDTGTWVGQGEAGMRDELKPLRARIAELVGEQGLIRAADREGLVALAAIAELEESDLDRLIEDVVKGDKTLAAKQRLARVIQTRVKAQQGALNDDTLASYESAAETVDWDRGKIKQLTDEAVADLAGEGTAKRGKRTSAVSASKFPIKPIAAALAVIVVLSAGGYGVYEWRQGQIIAEQAERERAAAAAEAETAWRDAQAEDSIEAYSGYLAQWPDGLKAEDARSRIEELEARGQSIIAQVQGYLNRLNYRVPESGELDPRTESAIRSFEEAQGLPVAGTVDQVLLESLVAEYKRRDEQAWQHAENEGSESAFENYRGEFPDGQYIDQVDEHIAQARGRAAWESAVAQNTEAAFEQYEQSYPQGQFIDQVSSRVDAIRQAEAEAKQRRLDAAAWETATGVDTIDAYESYTEEFSGGRYVAEAQSAIQSIEDRKAKEQAANSETSKAEEVSQSGLEIRREWESTRGSLQLRSESDRFSYTVGMDIGGSLREQDFEIDSRYLLAAITSAYRGEELWFGQDELLRIRQDFMDKKESGKPSAATDELSYTIGADIGSSLKKQDMSLEFSKLVAGLMDALEGRNTLLTNDQALKIRDAFVERKQASLESRNMTEGEQFLSRNAQRSEVSVTSSGLQYQILKRGSGRSPRPNDRVTVHYWGELIDGTKFDSSWDRGKPTSFYLNQVIPGWTEGLQLMKEGARYKFYVPAELAYGEQGRPGPIGPNSTLVFEVELIRVK